ncbi:MAG: N-acetylglucosamine-specific PTS transporter subunit IIBC [Bacteroidales bacterium]|nr:N-acetylglucosamine-specific PTS transporter subunit IIBC [Bacteroidales bacterium]
MVNFFQRLGKSLMLPVAVLPIAAILCGVGYWISPTSGNVIANFLTMAGSALLEAIPLLFAVGVSIGMAKKTDGTSALAGLVSWLIVTVLLSTNSIMKLKGLASPDLVDPAFAKIQNVFIGILCGLIGAFAYNKFKDTKLPDFLSFFSGRRCVAIVSGGMSLVMALILLFIWSPIYNGLTAFGMFISDLGPWGAAIYGFLNRLLIPLGLHHALNSVFWFDVAGINDLNNFLGGNGEFGVTGQYMTGFFPIMMFGLLGASLAMYHTAKTKNKKVVAGLLLSAGLASFLVGVTEPIEFAFMFLAPVLYLIHALFTGISLAIAAILPTRMGFGFSAGFIDLFLNWNNPMAQNPWMIFVMGIFWFAVYYIVFRCVIVKFNLKTPGREDDNEIETATTTNPNSFAEQAQGIIDGLGGNDNISELDNCITRLRLKVVDMEKVNKTILKKHGSKGVIKIGENSLQIVIGLNAQFVAEAMHDIISKETCVVNKETCVVNKEKVVSITAPMSGYLVDLKDVPDMAFSEKILGNGIAIQPTSGEVYAPFDAVVDLLFETKHALILNGENNVTILIHTGLDTVNMKGKGFEAFVKDGDRVKRGDLLIKANLDLIKEHTYNPITPIVVVNTEEYNEICVVNSNETIRAGDKMLEVK